jgi:kynurenine 3-monooxygenase
MQTPLKIAVVGSGLVGSLLAIYLRRAGHTVHVYDRSPDIRTITFQDARLIWPCRTAAGKR